MKKLSFILISCVGIIGCSPDYIDNAPIVINPIEEEPEENIPVSSNLLLSETTWEHYKDVYQYDSQRRFVSIVSTDTLSNLITSSFEFQYNGDQIQSIISKTFDTANQQNIITNQTQYNYNYISSHEIECVRISTNFATNSTSETTSNITLDNQSRLIAKDSYTFEYDIAGNLIKMNYPIGFEEFTYDSKRGCYSNVLTPSWVLLSLYGYGFENGLINNRLTKKYIYHSNAEDTNIYTDTYIYNQLDFPIKKTHMTSFGEVFVTFFKYQTFE